MSVLAQQILCCLSRSFASLTADLDSVHLPHLTVTDLVPDTQHSEPNTCPGSSPCLDLPYAISLCGNPFPEWAVFSLLGRSFPRFENKALKSSLR